ncbi:MAG: phosphoribosylanthranilate isomerase [Clostridiales bacterium]|nr:phosphoribosylanthranilate isomerase [Clostridiales bacterium]
MKIKICGLTRMADIEAVNAVRPDYIGFVFAKSRRQVNPRQAKALAEALLPSIRRVGVFVDERIETVLEIAEMEMIDVIQLHGRESAAYVVSLKRQTGLPVVKAVRVDQTVDMKERLRCYEAAGVDAFLFDNGPGGTGERFEWKQIPQTGLPYFLAGGICPDNVKAVMQLPKAPYALDVSSGVETDGVKDAVKIKQLVELVHRL